MQNHTKSAKDIAWPSRVALILITSTPYRVLD